MTDNFPRGGGGFFFADDSRHPLKSATTRPPMDGRPPAYDDVMRRCRLEGPFLCYFLLDQQKKVDSNANAVINRRCQPQPVTEADNEAAHGRAAAGIRRRDASLPARWSFSLLLSFGPAKESRSKRKRSEQTPTQSPSKKIHAEKIFSAIIGGEVV
ncbi:MAG: hypothetical protein SR2Q5_08285 [Quinella sp. 2Q5]|nr:hypothetical protein [Quinella sp. 2Q5]